MNLMGYVRIRLIVFIIFCFHFGAIHAQSDDSLPVDEIKLVGLKKTKERVLRQILKSNPGESATTKMIERDLQTLKNFSSIGDAYYLIDTIDNKLNITYDIREINTLIPIVNFGGIKNNIWFQAGFSDINLLGSGNSISASYRNVDKRSSGEVFFRALRVRGSKWGYSISLSKWSSTEPLYFPNDVTVNYDYDNNNLGLTGIHQFSLNRSVEFGGSIFEENFIKQGTSDLPGPQELLQQKYLGKIGYQENFVDRLFFSLKGFTWNFLFQKVYTKSEVSVFNHFVIESKYFAMPDEEVNFAFRMRFGISTNNNTPFAPFVVDSHINLRGVGNRIDRGTAQAVLNAEYRQTVFHDKNWGGQFIVFSDLGTWRSPGGALEDMFDIENVRHFIGSGIRLIYKPIYGAIIRIDYGFDLYRLDERGFVIGFGQYF